MSRIIVSLILSLLLAGTGHTMVDARGANSAVDRIVICAGAKAVVVYIDASGQPTHAPHICPDCALHGMDMAVLALLGVGAVPVYSHHAAGDVALQVFIVKAGRALARAPPVAI